MSKTEKYRKVDGQAVMDCIQPVFKPNTKIIVMQRSNRLYILLNKFNISTDSLISISLALYGIHNALEVSSYCLYDKIDREYTICLEGAIYELLPKFYEGQELVDTIPLIIERGGHEEGNE